MRETCGVKLPATDWPSFRKGDCVFDRSVHNRGREERATLVCSDRLTLKPKILRLPRRSAIQRCIGWMLVSVMAFALSGILVIPRSDRGSSTPSGERFPCEDCVCGCSTAEFCWDQCCCHSDLEKVAWADEHGVTPPKFLTDRVAHLVNAVLTVQTPAKSCCCGGKPSIAVPADSATAKCGETQSCPSPALSKDPLQSQDSQATAESQDSLRWVLMWKAAECRGIKTVWTALAQVYLQSQSAALLDPPALVHRLAVVNQSADSIPVVPEPPVP